jgi:DNA-binding LacI/PurR family transcriptional regulator
MPPAITSHDVAAAAGVSQPTVSLVLGGNRHARVAAATRERVIEAARRLGYRPNIVARALARGRSYALGGIVPELANPFFVDVIRGIERVTHDSGYAVLLGEAGESALMRHIEAMRARQVDGLILDAVGATSLPPDLLARLNVVLIDEPSERWPGVASDALAAGRLAAEHLLGLGHTQIGLIGPASHAWAFRMRERGFVQALRARGVNLPSEWLRRGPATVAGGRAAMQALLATGSPPGAVFCTNDLIAVGALKEALAAGLHVPSDLSVMGCDDIEIARLVTPELTTVSVPAKEIGARAARVLVRRLEGARPPGSGLLPVKLMVRGTTGRVA